MVAGGSGGQIPQFICIHTTGSQNRPVMTYITATTECHSEISRLAMAEPMKPVAPATRTRMQAFR